jgi:predicted nucleotidyltransferase
MANGIGAKEEELGYAVAAMNALVAERQSALAELCRRYGVERLDLFGSAATGEFDPASSDLDFIVRFGDREPGTYLARYLDFAEALERLFQRRVDLLTERSIRNPFFRREVEATRRTIYERRDEETAV